MTLKLFVLIQSCHISIYMVLVSTILELHVMRTVCSLLVVRNRVSFTLTFDNTRFCGLFEVLQAKVNCLLSVGPAHPVPRALNEHYSLPNNVSFNVFTYGWHVNILRKFHDPRVDR